MRAHLLETMAWNLLCRGTLTVIRFRFCKVGLGTLSRLAYGASDPFGIGGIGLEPECEPGLKPG